MIKSLLVFLMMSLGHAAELRLLSYNVYMIPAPVRMSKQSVRTQAFAEVFTKSRSEVILLQEAFSPDFRKQMAKALKITHPHQFHLPMKFDFTNFVSSGVAIFSKFPFKVLGSHYYKDCAGADCLASKGVVLIELEVEGKAIQIATTHLQASGRYSVIRQKQLMDVKNLLKKHERIGVPQVLAGDLNVDALAGLEFPTVLKLMGLNADGADLTQNSKAQKTSCFGKKDTTDSARKDHFLFRGPISAKTQVEYAKWTHELVQCDLSDHHPVSSVVNF